MTSWFAVARGITAHPLLKGHPARLAVWLWLIDNAMWKDTPHDVNGQTVLVKRGSVCVSERRLAREVGVGYQVVRTFLERLNGERMINASVTHGRTIISLCNYDKYQHLPSEGNARPNARPTQGQRTKEQGNTSVSEDTGAQAPFDPEKHLFDAGIELLNSAGCSDRTARNLIGKWKRDHGSAPVIAALGAAQRCGAVDPVAYCTQFLRKQPAAADPTAFGAFGRIPEVR